MQKETKQMRLFRRKSKWDRMLGTMATMAAKGGLRRLSKVGAGVIGGGGAATAKSAAISSLPPKDDAIRKRRRGAAFGGGMMRGAKIARGGKHQNTRRIRPRPSNIK